MTAGHSAAGSAVGYWYQTAWALLELLRRGPDMPDARITLELHDDVAWDAEGTPTERLQLKHHLNRAASIGDKAVDLWRTIGVWLDEASPADPDGAVLVLVTTALAPDGSGVSLLRPGSRQPAEALRLIELAAAESTSQESEANRARFLAMTDIDRHSMISRMYLVDGAPQAIDLDSAVRKQLTWVMPRGREDLFMQMLWGWWNHEALSLLMGHRGSIGVGEVQERVTDIRDQFAADRLPTLLHLADIDRDEVIQLVGDRTFVAQLRLIDWPEQNLQRALIDYYRAFVHTTRWVDDDLIGLPELVNFGLELIEEWKSEFEFMKIGLAADASEAELKAAGVALLRKLLASTSVRVRPRYDDAFFARGKRHELADQMQIGWHPDYERALGIEVSS
ncbi:MAG TPA: ABC-three component system protein [Acidimicrobiales bacterium]|nr:ABC-three component system protein [Acidimicrobiales bacterium]